MAPLLSVDQLHKQRPLYVELGHLVESGGWENNLGAVVELWSLSSRGHNERITSVVFVEALHNGSSSMASHVVEVLRISGVIPAAKA
jgi:hypothetical protein